MTYSVVIPAWAVVWFLILLTIGIGAAVVAMFFEAH